MALRVHFDEDNPFEDGHEVYVRSTQMTWDTDLPAPVLAGADVPYVDVDVDETQPWYVIVVAVKGSTKKPSNQVYYSPDQTPGELFLSGEAGVWYDPSDLSTLWQDVAGTSPVTADGDPVARIDDKSGNGLHATQSTSAARPIYRTDGTLHWLAFDGVDDHLASAVFDLSAETDLLVSIGVRKTDETFGQLVGQGDSQDTATPSVGAWDVSKSANLDGFGNRADYRASHQTTGALVVTKETQQTFTAPISNVVTVRFDTSQSQLARIAEFRVDGASAVDATADSGGGAGFLDNNPIFVGARDDTSSPETHAAFNLYGLVVRSSVTSSAAEIDDTEAYLAAQTGVTL